jgi:pimeloyl-ACP methyl ester carboxylesterase
MRAMVPIQRRIFRVLLIFFVIYVISAVFVTVRQRKFIYFPPIFDSATVDKLAANEQVGRWKNPFGETIGWKRMSPAQPAQGQILITHGNAGCAFQCGHYADAIQTGNAFNVFVVEYPGYADRPGVPTEKTLNESADEAFGLLNTNSPIYIVGESLGTGIACYLAGAHPQKISGVVLLAPYNRFVDVAQVHMPIFPVWLMLWDRFPSEDYLRKYHGPVAMLVAGQDQVIPEKFGRRLYDAYSGPKRIWEFPQGNHGTVMMQPPEVWKEILEFLQSNTNR